MNKKVLAMIGLVALMSLVGGASVFAQYGPNQATPIGPVIGGGTDSISGWVGILVTVVQWIYTIIFIIAVLFILLAAFNFITSKGDPTKTTTAKKQLLYAVIGIAVALLSYGVVSLVQGSLNNGLAR
jgi:ABC-type uncharacterized transport system permease subunit